jgi:endogenous inhibitor of DNA gyrase (YacG/DUF329 family)
MKKRINITIEADIHDRIPGNVSQFLEQAAQEKLNAANELRIPISPATREWVEDAAKAKGMTVADWLLSEFLLTARGWFTHCPKCKKPTHDTREMNIMPDDEGMLRYTIECPFCGHEWEHEEED